MNRRNKTLENIMVIAIHKEGYNATQMVLIANQCSGGIGNVYTRGRYWK
jgi:hypothetical protein